LIQKEKPSLLTSHRSLQLSGFTEEGNISNTVLIYFTWQYYHFFRSTHALVNELNEFYLFLS